MNRSPRIKNRTLKICSLASILLLGATSRCAFGFDFVTGAGDDGNGHVKRFDDATGLATSSFSAYGPSYTGGVRVAAGDVNGDGTPDIVTGAGPGVGSHVKVFDGNTDAEIRSFFAYGGGFTGGVYVAAGDVGGGSEYDIVTGSGNGGNTHVKVFNGADSSELYSFFAYPGVTVGEVRVAAGDVDGDHIDDIVTGLSTASHVKAFSGATGSEIRSFFAFPGFAGGVHVASGDVDGDGFSDIITGAGGGGSPHVKVFSGATGAELRNFIAYPGTIDELRVGAGDVDRDGFDDIITGLGPGAGPHVKVFSGATGAELRSFNAYDVSFSGGVYVAGITAPEPTSLLAVACVFAALPRRTRRLAA
jgi:hypothetical protein